MAQLSKFLESRKTGDDGNPNVGSGVAELVLTAQLFSFRSLFHQACYLFFKVGSLVLVSLFIPKVI